LEPIPADFFRLIAFCFVSQGVAGCGGQPPPAPKRLPYIAVELPPSTRGYEEHQHNARHPIMQVRFEIDPSDMILLEQRLPCRLGPVETGPPKHALVDRNEQPWYRPELATRHRGCDVERWRGDTSYSFLADVSTPGKIVVYAVLAYNWNPHH
jgi:hypothetical protein